MASIWESFFNTESLNARAIHFNGLFSTSFVRVWKASAGCKIAFVMAPVASVHL